MKTIINEMPELYGFLKGTDGLKIGYPWLTLGAIYSLERIMGKRNALDVLEIGGGGSTVFFAKRAKSVLTFEHNAGWVKEIKKALPKGSNVRIIHDTISKLEDFVDGLKESKFEVILVDSGYSYNSRARFLRKSVNKLKKDGWLIIDNYALTDKDFDYSGFDVFTFDMFQYSGRGTRLCRKLY